MGTSNTGAKETLNYRAEQRLNFSGNRVTNVDTAGINFFQKKGFTSIIRRGITTTGSERILRWFTNPVTTTSIMGKGWKDHL
jgi:hypothetical protein